MENLTVFARSVDVKVKASLMIKDFVEVMSKSTPGKRYCSDSFVVGQTLMAIKVYPNGHSEEDRGYVSVRLVNLSQTNIAVKCQFETDQNTYYPHY